VAYQGRGLGRAWGWPAFVYASSSFEAPRVDSCCHEADRQQGRRRHRGLSASPAAVVEATTEPRTAKAQHPSAALWSAGSLLAVPEYPAAVCVARRRLAAPPNVVGGFEPPGCCQAHSRITSPPRPSIPVEVRWDKDPKLLLMSPSSHTQAELKQSCHPVTGPITARGFRCLSFYHSLRVCGKVWG
jgi:hypothetical protein